MFLHAWYFFIVLFLLFFYSLNFPIREQKAMLALRLGYINAPARTETVAQLFHVEEQEVITLTKNCLKSASNTTNNQEKAKVYEKKN